MNGAETPPSPPDTLIGLGPPEPPEKYGADPTDAPETLRAWSTSGKVTAPEEAPADELYVPLESLFRRRIWHISRPSSVALEVGHERTASSKHALWAAPVVIASAAVVSLMIFSGERPRPHTGSHPTERSQSTTRVVGGPWVVREGAQLPQPRDESTEAARIPYRESQAPSRRSSARTLAPPYVDEERAAIASDQTRIRAIADTVRLEEDVAEPKEGDAVEPNDQ